MSKPPTLRQFQDRFPTEQACLDHLMRNRYGDRQDCEKCGRNAHFYRIKARRAYSCEHCGHQVYPTCDTPFHRTRTSLRDWFYVMFLFTTTRNGVAAKRVQREIGVTYKTAWRMCDQIREYLRQLNGDEPIGGFMKKVQIDEAYIGGASEGTGTGNYRANKSVVLGMLEKGGNLVAQVVPNRRGSAILPVIKRTVKPHTEVHTDEHAGYEPLGRFGYWHKTVNHSAKVYVGPTGATVNAIEGFWAQIKRMIRGTHIHVSAKHLPKYLAEAQYRWNMRQEPHLMLARMMLSFER